MEKLVELEVPNNLAEQNAYMSNLLIEISNVCMEYTHLLDFSDVEFNVLEYLYTYHLKGIKLSQRDLQERLKISKQFVNVIISKFVKDKLVTFQKSKEDSRIKFIRLTPKGVSSADNIYSVFHSIFTDTLLQLTEEERLLYLRCSKFNLLKLKEKIKLLKGEALGDSTET